MRRVLVLLAAGALVTGVLVGTGRAQSAGRTWQVAVGADSSDHAVQVLDYYPRAITIDAGDSVTWTKATIVEHTVTFLSGRKAPPLDLPQKDGRVMINPLLAFPHGGPSYDGTGIAGSGIVAGTGKRWTLRFTRPGRYTYVCVLHPAQVGTVIVRPAGTPLLETQGDYERAARQARAAALAAGAKLRAATKAVKFKGEHGAIYTQPLVGDPTLRIALYRFGTDTLTVKVGDTVRWQMRDPDEIHTVTFVGAGSLPAFIVPEPRPQGPPGLYYNPKVLAPAGGPEHKGAAYYNSGILIAANPPGPDEYTLTFTRPGTFTYWCVVHIPEGMRGAVVVTP